MLYDNEILRTLNAAAKPLTLKEALSLWGHDPMWHKLVANGYIQYYPHAVTVTSLAKKWLKERELHHWVLEQRLQETENEADCQAIYEYARMAHFSDIQAKAYDKANASSIKEMERELEEMDESERTGKNLTYVMIDLCLIDLDLIHEYFKSTGQGNDDELEDLHSLSSAELN